MTNEQIQQAARASASRLGRYRAIHEMTEYERGAFDERERVHLAVFLSTVCLLSGFAAGVLAAWLVLR